MEQFGPQALPRALDWDALADWWLVHKQGANTPNWDLVATCSVGGQTGLVLVEAKANVPELRKEGKALDSDASERSRENHEHIKRAIEQARTALDGLVGGVRISRDQHYQLSNRVAFSWRLASMGLPTVLVYLGFLGDTEIADVGEPLMTAEQWEKVMRDHVRNVLPEQFLEQQLSCGPATMQMIVRSRRITEPSPPAG